MGMRAAQLKETVKTKMCSKLDKAAEMVSGREGEREEKVERLDLEGREGGGSEFFTLCY